MKPLEMGSWFSRSLKSPPFHFIDGVAKLVEHVAPNPTIVEVWDGKNQ